MKIQPIDFNTPGLQLPSRYEAVKPVAKSFLKRFFDFPSFLRVSVPEKVAGTGTGTGTGVVEGFQCSSEELEPTSVCLDKMVQNFMEESNEKQSAAIRCGRQQCNCFNCDDSSEDELDSFNCFGNSNHSSTGDACELLKTLVLCDSVSERNLLADTAKIVEKNKICKRKDENCRKIVADSLFAIGYDASICKSRWEKCPSYPAGEYEYVDVVIGEERLIIDVDFRSEFEIARSTKSYRAILQTLPYIFVGKSDRLQRIIHIVSEAAKQSLKKKGMPFPPWRKADYVKAKWLSPYTKTNFDSASNKTEETDPKSDGNEGKGGDRKDAILIGKKDEASGEGEGEGKNGGLMKQWEPVEMKPKDSKIGFKVISGLASVIEED